MIDSASKTVSVCVWCVSVCGVCVCDVWCVSVCVVYVCVVCVMRVVCEHACGVCVCGRWCVLCVFLI